MTRKRRAPNAPVTPAGARNINLEMADDGQLEDSQAREFNRFLEDQKRYEEEK